MVDMTTPIDAARPVVRWDCFVGEDLGGNPCVDDREDPHGRYVRFEDFDALRSEVERLRDWQRELCERLGFDCAAGAEWTAEEVATAQIKHLTTAAENTARFMRRAEAAEAMNNHCRAVLTELENGIGMANRAGLNVEGSYAVKATGLCVDLLRAALNAQGESNG